MSKTMSPDFRGPIAKVDGRRYLILAADIDGVLLSPYDGGPALVLSDEEASDLVRDGRMVADSIATGVTPGALREAELHDCVFRRGREELAARSMASMEAAIRDIHGETHPIPASPEEVADHGPPHAPALRGWSRRHEGGGSGAFAPVDRRRGKGRHSSAACRAMAPFVTRYATAERPTVLNCYRMFVAHAWTLNEARVASGRVPFRVPSLSTFARAVGALDRFHVVSRRHGHAAARRLTRRAR